MNGLPVEITDLFASASALPLTRAGFQSRTETKGLTGRDPKELFPNAKQPNAAFAGFLLRLGDWDGSHNVAQDIDSVEGSYWHGMIHRMEPDPPNAKYWFRRVGQHPIFPELHQRAHSILAAGSAEPWAVGKHWDPLLFVDWCEDAQNRGGEWARLAAEIQMAEWELLFQFCLS